MKLIIEPEATFENNSDVEVNKQRIKIHYKHLYKGNIMNQDMLNSHIHLTRQAIVVV